MSNSIEIQYEYEPALYEAEQELFETTEDKNRKKAIHATTQLMQYLINEGLKKQALSHLSIFSNDSIVQLESFSSAFRQADQNIEDAFRTSQDTQSSFERNLMQTSALLDQQDLLLDTATAKILGHGLQSLSWHIEKITDALFWTAEKACKIHPRVETGCREILESTKGIITSIEQQETIVTFVQQRQKFIDKEIIHNASQGISEEATLDFHNSVLGIYGGILCGIGGVGKFGKSAQKAALKTQEMTALKTQIKQINYSKSIAKEQTVLHHLELQYPSFVPSPAYPPHLNKFSNVYQRHPFKVENLLYNNKIGSMKGDLIYSSSEESMLFLIQRTIGRLPVTGRNTLGPYAFKTTVPLDIETRLRTLLEQSILFAKESGKNKAAFIWDPEKWCVGSMLHSRLETILSIGSFSQGVSTKPLKIIEIAISK